LVSKRELPPNAEAGYLYDSIRQQQKSKREQIEKYAKMRKKMDKLTRKNKYIKPKK
jgi:hypothetical protein